MYLTSGISQVLYSEFEFHKIDYLRGRAVQVHQRKRLSYGTIQGNLKLSSWKVDSYKFIRTYIDSRSTASLIPRPTWRNDYRSDGMWVWDDTNLWPPTPRGQGAWH